MAMQAHQALDRRNGFHKHNMGAALGLAAPELSPDEVAFFRAAKLAGDSARRKAFDESSVKDPRLAGAAATFDIYSDLGDAASDEEDSKKGKGAKAQVNSERKILGEVQGDVDATGSCSVVSSTSTTVPCLRVPTVVTEPVIVAKGPPEGASSASSAAPAAVAVAPTATERVPNKTEAPAAAKFVVGQRVWIQHEEMHAIVASFKAPASGNSFFYDVTLENGTEDFFGESSLAPTSPSRAQGSDWWADGRHSAGRHRRGGRRK